MAPALVNATIQAALLSAISNILAQVFQAYRTAQPVILDTTPIVNFVVHTILNTPPNFLWQEFLEQTFPGFTVTPGAVKSTETSSEGNTALASFELHGRKLHVRNTLIKFGLDQTVGAFINTIFFVGTMSALKGAGSQSIVQSIKNDSFPLMIAAYKLWPLVSLISFTLIPVQHRVVFGSIIGVGWGIFLSLFANH